MKYNGWLIVEVNSEYVAHGLVELPCVLETKHNVIKLSNESEYLAKCEELNVELNIELDD